MSPDQEFALRRSISRTMGRLMARSAMDVDAIEATVQELENARINAGWEPILKEVQKNG